MTERNTKQKSVILDAVLSATTHPTAEQVYEKVATQIPNISLGTVYRNLNKLAECGQIRKVAVPDRPDRFDRTLHPHNHIICISCGAFGDIEDVPYDTFLSAGIAKNGFEIIGHETVFFGKCQHCKN